MTDKLADQAERYRAYERREAREAIRNPPPVVVEEKKPEVKPED